MNFYLQLIIVVFLLNLAAFGAFIYGAVKFRRLTKAAQTREAVYLERIKKRADSVIEEAVEKGEGIVTQAEYFKNALSQDVEQSLEETAKTNIARFDKGLSVLSNQAAVKMQQSIASLEAVTEKKFEEILSKADSDIERMKQNKIAAIDKAVADKVSELSLKLLGKSITLDEHDELVLESLEKAKKEGIL